VLLVVGAAFVGPFEDDVFAFVLREGVLDSVGVSAFEVRGRRAWGYGECGKSKGGESESEEFAVGHFGASTTAVWMYFATDGVGIASWLFWKTIATAKSNRRSLRQAQGRLFDYDALRSG
jgi:hypothetical protein